MGISYRKLFRLMESKGIKKIDLRKSGLSPTIVDRLIKNKNVNTSTIIELCKMLECQPADIMEYVVDLDKQDIIEDQSSIPIQIQEQLFSIGFHIDSIKSRINDLKDIANNNKLFPLYNNVLLEDLNDISYNIVQTTKENLCIWEIELLKAIEPIIHLEFWQEISYYTVKNNKYYKLNDAVLFVILRSLALINDYDVWMEENDDGTYFYIYKNKDSMLYFAKHFEVKENEIQIQHLINLYIQFNSVFHEIITALQNENVLIRREMRLFNEDCLPYIINALNYFNSIETAKISFKDVVLNFILSGMTREFIMCDEEDSEVYNLSYAVDNVRARIDFLKEYIDDFLDNVEDE